MTITFNIKSRLWKLETPSTIIKDMNTIQIANLLVDIYNISDEEIDKGFTIAADNKHNVLEFGELNGSFMFSKLVKENDYETNPMGIVSSYYN